MWNFLHVKVNIHRFLNTYRLLEMSKGWKSYILLKLENFLVQDFLMSIWFFRHNLKFTWIFYMNLVPLESRLKELSNNIWITKIGLKIRKLWHFEVGASMLLSKLVKNRLIFTRMLVLQRNILDRNFTILGVQTHKIHWISRACSFPPEKWWKHLYNNPKPISFHS